jgi:hypothetical protein
MENAKGEDERINRDAQVVIKKLKNEAIDKGKFLDQISFTLGCQTGWANSELSAGEGAAPASTEQPL